MNADLLKRAVEIFGDVADLTDSRCSAELDQRAGADPALRALVEEMLACDRQGPSVELTIPAIALPEEAGPLRIGHYEIVRLIAEGGMGAVYEARQDTPRRSVALKLLRTSVPTRELVARFRREAELLGRLHHPGIAAVFEAGTARPLTAEGYGPPQSFLAMELVRGPTITQWCAREGVRHRDRVELMAAVCDAVEHAHQHGIVHRDLKPANILVDEGGTPGSTPTPSPKVLDFGVARVLDPDGAAPHTLQTEAGRVLGTLPYMSPEQVGGRTGEADRRTDIYALGTILYEVLSGRQPLDLAGRSIAEAARIIREEEPSRLGSLSTLCRGDLDTIVAKAMSKDPARRYGTAAELAADLRRHLRDEPIVARPASAAYQLRKFAKRNKALVGGVAAVFVVLLLGVIGTTTFALRERRRAQETNKVADFQAEMLAGINVPQMGDQLRDDLLELAAEEWRRSGRSDEEIKARGAELEEKLADVNFTTAALRSLDHSIFDRTLKAIDETFADQPLVRARLLQRVASTLRTLGLFDRALAPQTEALQVRRRELPADHLDTLASTDAMATLLAARLQYAEAEPYARTALEGRRRVLGPSHLDTLSSCVMLGHVLQRQSKFAEAEKCQREALDGRRRILGDNHPDTLESCRRMGQLLLFQNRFAEAEPIVRDALERARHNQGDQKEITLMLTVCLANLCERLGKPDESETLWRIGAEGLTRLKSGDHRDTLFARAGLGKLLMHQNRLDAAEPYLTEWLKRCTRIEGPENPDTLLSLRTLGELRLRQGQLDAAETLSRDALDRYRRVNGPNHAETMTCAAQLATVLDKAGKSDAAAEVRRQYGTPEPSSTR